MLFGPGGAVKLGVSATIVYDVTSATNSSPQTTEINAKVRAETLMKWVHLGLGQAAIFVLLMAVAAKMEGEPTTPVFVGGGLAIVLLYAQYVHARNAGLAAGGAATEVYGGTG